jgi:curved DNA-binding protein
LQGASVEYKDYYQILGVDRDASADEIKRAYRKKARRYHPDVSNERDAESRFQELQEAYEVLKDPDKRAAYDNVGRDWQGGQGFRTRPDGERGASFASGGYTEADARGFSEFFESLFGRAPGGADGFADPGGRGEDHFARVEIGLEQAYHGGQHEVSLQAPTVDARGGVQAQPRKLNVRIPPGVADGQQIRLAKQGGPGPRGGAAGDLYLEIRIRPHRLFRLDGRDLHLDVPIAPWEAALGARVTVPTPAGEVEARVPAGARSGQQLRLQGRGLPATPPGDQYLHLRIVTPRPDTDADRALYERMREQMAFDPRAPLRGRAA